MLGLIKTRFDDLEQTFQAMTRVKLDRHRLTEYLAGVYPDSTEPEKQVLVQRDRGWSEYLLRSGKGKSDGWCGWNSVGRF